ncbi:unnamed protein product [Calicophoron daubneyi]|uniref:t-SNARE coiled-coil homology domain-containing protein n=1 Tax=Calicophoron daubneyi TaxID=300641 RepID=A0AAV2TEX8_CALDB
MVKDRLPELQSRIKANGDRKVKTSNENANLDSQFLVDASELRQTITELHEHVQEVEKVQRDILASPQQNDKLDERLLSLTKTIRQKAYDVRSALKGFEENQNEKASLLSSALERVKSAQHAAITRQFVDVMNEYNQCQLDYRDKCKSRIQRKLNVAGYSCTESELDDMLEKKNPEIFTQAIMADTEAAKRSLSDIEARHADIMRLEKSIEELRDLFMATALMVDQQSELVDRIEYNFGKAGESVVQAKGQLTQAIGKKRKSRHLSDSRAPPADHSKVCAEELLSLLLL